MYVEILIFTVAIIIATTEGMDNSSWASSSV